MGIYKNYFDKCNTIIRGSEANTANNPVTELAFGKRVTRFLFYIDMKIIKDKILNKEIIITPDARHILKMKSTLDFSINPYLNKSKDLIIDGTSRPTSFDMELYPLTEAWDAGTGYDFTLNPYRRIEDVDYVQSPSNWLQSTTDTNWSVPGAISSGTTSIATQHFDTGNEDIEMDITEYVNFLISDIAPVNYGFCLKFKKEVSNDALEYVIGFFTKTTQTFFEPYIETTFNDVIRDDRNKMFLNKVNKLYMYTNVGGKLTNLDQLPVCTIPQVGILPVLQQSKGIYYVEFNPLGSLFTSYKKYFDTWSSLIVNGNILSDVKMDFIPKEESEYYQISNEMVLPQHYGLSLSGIKQEEKITSGEMRRINVLVRKPYTVNQNDVIDDIFYRIYVKVGHTQFTVIDFSPVSRSNIHNYFTLDSIWMIPNRYYVDIKIIQNGEVLLYNDQLVFNIISRKKQ